MTEEVNMEESRRALRHILLVSKNSNFSELNEIEKEIFLSYADCHMFDSGVDELCRLGYSARNLNYHSEFLSFHDALNAMRVLVDYNNFIPQDVEKIFLEILSDDVEISIGRESSVVMYLKAEEGYWNDDLQRLLFFRTKADEISLEDNVLRLWWD